MRSTSKQWVQMSDAAILKHIGSYLKHIRIQQNKSQAQLADMSGLNRWTISQIENGESITLTSFIQIVRALDIFYVLDSFEIPDEISPLEYAKLKKKEKKRVRNKTLNTPDKGDLGW